MLCCDNCCSFSAVLNQTVIFFIHAVLLQISKSAYFLVRKCN